MEGLRETAQADGALEGRVTDLIIRLTILGLFVYWSLQLVKPFLPIVIWAVILVVALNPLHAWLAERLGRRPRLAAALITVLALAVVIGPVGALAASLAESLQDLANGLHAGTLRPPPPPSGVADWPLVGEQVQAAWSLASTNLGDAIKRFGPTLLPAAETVLYKVAAIGGDLLKFVVAVLIAGFMFVSAPQLTAGTRRFVGRIIAPRGANFVDMAGATIRNVSRGVIGVALLQALIAGVVLQFADVPAAGLLAFGILVLCVIQIGPAPILLPVIIWAWTAMSGGAALVFTLVLVPIMLIDNVLKPILMARGLKTPTLVILLGVIGGTLGYGLIGLFLGPIVLAIFYELLVGWVNLETSMDPEAAGN